jgi:RNA polymerase sigma-70 factor (ECF subfamily)
MDDTDFEGALAAAAAGAESAFARLWREHQPVLLRYLRVAAADAAEDLASETWLEASRDLGGFSGGSDAFRAWLFTIARHQVLDHRRRGARRPKTAGPDVPDRSGGPDPADAVEEALSTERALRLIATLPPDQAEALVLRVVGGLDVAAVARIMGKRPGHVRVLTHRGLRALERLVTP